MSKLTEKYDKMYNMIEVSVVHKAFRKEPKEVAQVWVDKNLNMNQILDKAFMLTNSINDAWWNNNNLSASIEVNGTWSGADTYRLAELVCGSLKDQGFLPISNYSVTMVEVSGRSKLVTLNCK